MRGGCRERMEGEGDNRIEGSYIWVKFTWGDIPPKSVFFLSSLTLHYSNMVHCTDPIFVLHVAWIHPRPPGNVLFWTPIVDGGLWAKGKL